MVAQNQCWITLSVLWNVLSSDLPRHLETNQEATRNLEVSSDPRELLEEKEAFTRSDNVAVRDILESLQCTITHMLKHVAANAPLRVGDQDLREKLLSEVFSAAVLLHARVDNILSTPLAMVHLLCILTHRPGTRYQYMRTQIYRGDKLYMDVMYDIELRLFRLLCIRLQLQSMTNPLTVEIKYTVDDVIEGFLENTLREFSLTGPEKREVGPYVHLAIALRGKWLQDAYEYLKKVCTMVSR